MRQIEKPRGSYSSRSCRSSLFLSWWADRHQGERDRGEGDRGEGDRVGCPRRHRNRSVVPRIPATGCTTTAASDIQRLTPSPSHPKAGNCICKPPWSISRAASQTPNRATWLAPVRRTNVRPKVHIQHARPTRAPCVTTSLLNP